MKKIKKERYRPKRVREDQAFKRLLQWIHCRDLQAGDKLPPQAELCEHLGFSSCTVSRAMKALVEHGVVTRKTHVGTIIADPAAAPTPDFVVALLLNWPTSEHPSAFFAQLACLVQAELLEAGCLCRNYGFRKTPDTPCRSADFRDLEEDLSSGHIDAILSIGWFDLNECRSFRASGVPVCFATHWDLAPCGALIDMAAFASAAMDRALNEGCRRLALVFNGDSGNYGRCDAAARSALKAWRGEHASYEVIVPGASGVSGGFDVARLLLERPEEERPDALLIPEDYLAMGLAQVLNLESDYAPTIMVVTHHEAPLAFALPVQRFELNDKILARAGVQILRQRLMKPNLPNEVAWIAPEPVDDPPERQPQNLPGSRGRNVLKPPLAGSI